MAVLFCWENRRDDKISLENLRLATELSDGELRKTLWSLVNAPKLKRQVLLFEPASSKPAEWDENTLFWINQVNCYNVIAKTLICILNYSRSLHW